MQPRPRAAAIGRRSLLAGGVAAGAATVLARWPVAGAASAAEGDAEGRAFGFPAPDLTSKVVKDITFPAAGPVTWSDTYGACRSGCTRRHEGQDLIGPKMTKLVACVDGTIVEARHRSDGNSIYLEGTDGWFYAYLHINNDTPGTDDGKNPLASAFAPGIVTGVKVKRGQHIAYMGDSGNAESSVSHLHFEIRRPADKWYSAQAVNPKYSLDAARPAPRSVPGSTFAPWDNARAFVVQQYRDFIGGPPSAASLDYYAKVLDTGAHSPAWLIEVLLRSSGCQDTAGGVARLYPAFFARPADAAGLAYWLHQTRTGTAVGAVAERFAGSQEFLRRYGHLSDRAYIDQVYANVLHRPADDGGRSYWSDQLRRRVVSRGRMMLRFSESDENRAKLRTGVDVILLHVLMTGSAAEPVIATWSAGVAMRSTSIQALADSIRTSRAYAARF